MDIDLITKKFEEMGARVKFNILPTVTREGPEINIRIDIQNDNKGNFFLVEFTDKVTLSVPDVQKVDRHLLLFMKDPELQRFLCGHDERSWFVAAIPESSGASNVKEAKEALKPQRVKYSPNKKGEPRIRRQGEWFFIPQPRMNPPENMILKNEPISRTGGTPHMVEELYRMGGMITYISSKFPNGLSEEEYKKRIEAKPELKKIHWQQRRVNARVLARGRITHRDHKTVVLRFWHEVLMNTEAMAKAMRHLAFID